MSIKITRDSGWMGTLPKMKLFLDEKEVARISQNETIYLEIEDSTSILQAKQLGMKSNKIEVQDGDNLVVKPGKYTNILFIIYLLGIVLLGIFSKNLLYVFLLGIIYALTSVWIDPYSIEKL